MNLYEKATFKFKNVEVKKSKKQGKYFVLNTIICAKIQC